MECITKDSVDLLQHTIAAYRWHLLSWASVLCCLQSICLDLLDVRKEPSFYLPVFVRYALFSWFCKEFLDSHVVATVVRYSPHR